MGSDSINLITDAQKVVALADAGKIEFPTLLDHLVAVDRAEGDFGNGLLEFVGIVYHELRILEAVLHWSKGKNLEGKFAVKLMIIARNAQNLRPMIEEQLEINGSYATTSEIERFGQWSIEKELREALRRLDQFDQWGYSLERIGQVIQTIQ